MSSITIAHRLWFDQTLSGATLNYQTGEGADSVLFRVGISTSSLEDCLKHLWSPFCDWSIQDCSLIIVGDSEELRLTFCGKNSSGIQGAIALYGDELEAFKTVVHGFVNARHAQNN